MELVITIILGIALGAVVTYYFLKSQKKEEPTFDFQGFVQANNLPITQALDNLNNKILDLEKNRSHTDATLSQQLSELKNTNNVLFETTNTLSKVLSNSQSQGALGEMHLKTLLESCGLVEKVDFNLQVRLTDEHIPDCVIKLPNNKFVIIDCKSPTKSLLEYIEADEASKAEKLKKLNVSIKTHIRSLADKAYQKDLKDCSEYILMYLPSDSLLITAITADPNIVLYANSKNVVLTAPSTIIPCIRNIELLWRQENLNKNIQEVVELNTELQASALETTEALHLIGRSLTKAVEAHSEGLNVIQKHLKQVEKLKNLGK
jgi:DNA recombination protein RmuC